MKKVEYYCCWLNIYNAQAVQDFLDEKGQQGWVVSHIVPEFNRTNNNSFFVMIREIIEQ